MKIVKTICKHLILFTLALILTFFLLMTLFLLIDVQFGFFVSIFMCLSALGSFSFCIYEFVKDNKVTRLPLFIRTNQLVLLSYLSLAYIFVSFYFFSINLMITTELGKDLSLEEKIDFYTLPFQKEPSNSINYQRMKENKLTHQYQNFTIYYKPHEKELLPIIERAIDKADYLTSGLLGAVKDNEIDFIIHASSDELYKETSLIKTMGYFDDPNDIVGIAITDLDEITADRMPGSFYFQSTIMHEYTHYRLQAFIKEQGLFVYRIPLWFHEGVAEYIGMYDVKHRYYPFKDTSFENLVTHKEWEKFRLDNYDVYLQSYYAIRYIVDTYGETIIKEIIEETAKVNDFNKGFAKATGISIDDLQTIYLLNESEEKIEMKE
ncbi:hypothetical protein ACFPRB_18100 [Metabacillus niabensis]|uniref:Peptidase MA-like domain-containing protein n=2 Tax=Metabacillus niabensis TaxID=324854 RepID=A0ABT9Z8N9_9BACI|nr:hypothetical protein [Metabacillus niabensis]MDQ0228614.1 hypothetical protein [Metabacillus niabensis]